MQNYLTLQYIGPGLGVGAILLLIFIATLILFSFVYLLWYKIKNRKK
jgi:hypothetical protein